MATSDADYVLLLSGEPDGVKDEEGEGPEGPQKELNTGNRLGWWTVYGACAVSILCCIINAYLAERTVALLPRPRSSAPLEYAKAYLGLETVYRGPTSPPRPAITNFPAVFALVNQSEPITVYVDTHRKATYFGTVYPEDRRILITPVERTYVQFWAGDFGMERCALKFSLPPPRGDVTLSESATVVDVWHANSSGSLDVHSLSWKRRPRRGSLIASLTIEHNATAESAEFACPSGSYQTFELACGIHDCRVDFRQTPDEKDLGIWLVQRPSI